MWRIYASAARHRVGGKSAAEFCGALARRWRSIVSKAQHLQRSLAYRRVGRAALFPSWGEIFAYLFENTILFLEFDIDRVLIDDISNS